MTVFEQTHSELLHGQAAPAPNMGRSCGKQRYADKKSAVTKINALKKARGRHGRPEWLRAYPCPDCGGWHLTKGKAKPLWVKKK